jgi:hypothetical protein
MVRRGSESCGCPSWSDVDPTVRAVAEAMAKRDGFRFPATAGVLKNFLPLAEVAVAEVRRLDAPVDPLSSPPNVRLATDGMCSAEPPPVAEADVGRRSLPVADLIEVIEPTERTSAVEDTQISEALLFLRLVETSGSPALDER